MAFTIFERWSPEYALNNTFEDMNKSGVDGLKKHLTANAIKNLESIETVSGGVAFITSAFMGANPVSFLLDKLSECEWTIKDVMKGTETSKAVIAFNYQDSMTGTIELKMIKEDKLWKIDGLAAPKFDKFEVSQRDTDEPSKS